VVRAGFAAAGGAAGGARKALRVRGQRRSSHHGAASRAPVGALGQPAHALVLGWTRELLLVERGGQFRRFCAEGERFCATGLTMRGKALTNARARPELQGRFSRMQRLSGLDASFLYAEWATVHMHTLKIAVLDPGTRADGIDRFSGL